MSRQRLVPESSPTEPLYLRAEDVAAMLQVSKATVFRMVKRDPTMPALVLGGVVRFPKDRLLVWLRAREQGPGRARRNPVPCAVTAPDAPPGQ